MTALFYSHGRFHQRSLAIRHSKAEPLRIALRGGASLRYHHRVFATGFGGHLHALTEQRRLQPAPAKLRQRSRPKQGNDAVVRPMGEPTPAKIM